MLSELLFGNAIIRNDNSNVVEHLHAINAVARERRSDGFLESNREEAETNPWLALSHITGPLNIPDDMAKTTTRKKSIALLARGAHRTIDEKNINVLRKTNPAGK